MIFGRKHRHINRIMIVEDEALIAFDNEIFLQSSGYEVIATVNSAEEAIEILENNSSEIEAIILDYNLAGPASGVAVAHVATAKAIPVLFVTGECPETLGGYAIGCLSKPYPQKHLLAALEVMEQIGAGKAVRRVPATMTLFAPHSAQG